MHTYFLLLTTLAVVAPVFAFTNGSLVPGYICNSHPDGLPKSFGQLLPYTREQVGTIAFNENAGDNIDSVPIFVTNNTAVKVANTAYILASFHNTLNSLTAIQQGLKVTVVNGTVLKAGTREPLLLNTGTEGVALAGAMLYAQEGAKRVGSFTDTGKKFVKFPGCGKNQNGKYVGVIQEDIVSEDATYSMLSFNVPTCVPSGNITMAGLSVTDKGFGVWKYTFLVTGSKCSSEESTNHHFSLVNDRKGEEDRN